MFVRVSIAVIEHQDQKQFVEKKGLFQLTIQLHSIIEGGQGGKLETGTEADVIGEYCLLACPPGSLSLFF